jgi:protein TonB
MEPKKNPKYDVHRKRGLLLHVGVIVSLVVMIAAFEWKIPVSTGDCVLPAYREEPPEVLLSELPRSTDFKNRKIPKPVRAQVIVPAAAKFTAVEEFSRSIPDPGIDQYQPVLEASVGSIDVPEEAIPADTFRIVETMPEPVGGWEAFYKTLRQHLKYPRQAQRTGTRGKVFVEFTVNDRGELSRFKVLKGIGNGCDEEACRVIRLTKWKAGKQRGRPVNVRMVQPMNFSLN